MRPSTGTTRTATATSTAPSRVEEAAGRARSVRPPRQAQPRASPSLGPPRPEVAQRPVLRIGSELEEYVLPKREYEGYVEEELQQLLSMLRYDEQGEHPEESPESDEAHAAFDLRRLREAGTSVLAAFPMLGSLQDADAREL